MDRVSRVVGKEGRLTQRATPPAAGGAWRSRVNAVNHLIEDLVRPTAEMARVIGGVAKGDLTQTVALEAEGQPLRGEFLRTAKMVNAMVKQLDAFAAEVTRVAREVGTEGKLGGQAVVPGVAGTWKDLTDSVNSMAGNLTAQVRNIADVTTAVANGDLSKKITVDVRGEILQLKNTINTMVDQLRTFASEVTRVAREVGTEGKLGGQAEVKGVAGTWKDLTDNVNFMAGNLTAQVRNIAEVTTAVANGDLSKKITVDVKGEILELKNTINTMVDQLRSLRLRSHPRRPRGRHRRKARRPGRSARRRRHLERPHRQRQLHGRQSDSPGAKHRRGDDRRRQRRPVQKDHRRRPRRDSPAQKHDQHHGGSAQRISPPKSPASPAKSAPKAKLGGQAQVKGVTGAWKDLTDSVNIMAGNLTAQVRNIADVTIAVANGDLSKKITVDVRGEILAVKETINTMVDQLNAFAAEVTRVAREVGTEGKLGGQAQVRGVAGTWKDLTDNVNLMAGNLTAQVRNIAEVTIAVANGDLSKKITVDVKGEILELKNTINTMVDQLNAFAAEVTRVAREVGTEGKLGGQADVERRRRHLERSNR